MTVEKARARAVTKPWGSVDPSPWSSFDGSGEPLGEIRFERSDPAAPTSALLFKLLFAARPLSIQVHPDDDLARSRSLPGGKSEAWYVLAAAPGAEVVSGLRRPLDESALRAAVADGSIIDLVARRAVRRGEVVYVPAGTIHAVGAGLVIAEIQQNSDTTWRLHDYGSGREIHVDDAVAAVRLDAAAGVTTPGATIEGRTRLVVDRHFVLEHLDLPASSRSTLVVASEAWLLVVAGEARIGTIEVIQGEAVYLDQAGTVLSVGPDGGELLLAHTGRRPHPSLTPLCDGHSAGTPAPALEGLS